MEDFGRLSHPGGLCHKHVFCGGVCDVPEQCDTLRFGCAPLSGLSVLCGLSGELNQFHIFSLIIQALGKTLVFSFCR